MTRSSYPLVGLDGNQAKVVCESVSLARKSLDHRSTGGTEKESQGGGGSRVMTLHLAIAPTQPRIHHIYTHETTLACADSGPQSITPHPSHAVRRASLLLLLLPPSPSTPSPPSTRSPRTPGPARLQSKEQWPVEGEGEGEDDRQGEGREGEGAGSTDDWRLRDREDSGHWQLWQSEA